MHRCLRTLSEAGYRCLLLGRERPGSKPLDPALPFAQERHRLRASSGKHFYWQLNRAHYRRLKSLRPRAILVVDLDTMWSGARAAARLGVPWVYDAHELFTDTPEVDHRPLIKRAWRWLAERYVARAAARYTVGEHIAREHATRYGCAFGVVRNYPEARPSRGHAGERAGRFTVIYQGALNAGRGLEQLIEAVAQRDDFDVWIVGTGDLDGELRSRVPLSARSRVTFWGERTPAELAAVTRRAHLGYALMEDRGLNYRLSLSNKSVDYVHAGLPSLQMDWPEYRRIHEAYGCYLLVQTLSVGSLLQAIESARAAHRYEFMEVGCRAAAADLTWASQAPELLRIWRSVLPPSA